MQMLWRYNNLKAPRFSPCYRISIFFFSRVDLFLRMNFLLTTKNIFKHIYTHIYICSVQLSCLVVSNSLWPCESQHARPPCPSSAPRVHSDSGSSSRDAIQPSHPRSSPSPPAPNPSQHQSLFQWVSSSHQVAKVLSSLGKPSLGEPVFSGET